MTYYSRSYYPGDGTTKDFTVGFPYLDKGHVQVVIDGELATGWTWVNDSTVRINPAPEDGSVVLIRRATSPEARLVDYVSPSSLNEDDLDKDSIQAFYLAQEANDAAGATVADDPETGQFTAQGKRIRNVADPVDDQDAATKNWVMTALVSPVATAIAKAAEAVAAALTATTKASEASGSASTASSAASTATTKASEAAASALEAKGYRDTAKDHKDDAEAAASTATTKAGDAAGYAEDASDYADAAASSASTASTKASEAAEARDDAVAAKLAAESAAGSMTPVEDQILAAPHTTFTVYDHIPAVDYETGALIRWDFNGIRTSILGHIGSYLNTTAAAKTTPTDNDLLVIADSNASWASKGLSLGNLWLNRLKAKADALYLTIANVATASQYLAASVGKVLTGDKVWEAAVPVDLGDLSGNVTLDFATFINGYADLNANSTLNAVANMKSGQTGVISIWNTGSYTLSVNTTYFKTPEGNGLTLAAGRNLLSYHIDADSKVFVSVAGKAVA